MFKRRWFWVALIIVACAIGVWWWQWRAPYHTLIVFLRALEAGDFDTLYALTPSYERKYVKIDTKLIRHTYANYLKPLFLSKYRLIRIQRISHSSYSPELWVRSREVPFFLWYQDNQGQLKVTAASVVRPIGEKGWKVPFSYFVYCVTKTLYGVDRVFKVMQQLGYPTFVSPVGGIVQEP